MALTVGTTTWATLAEAETYMALRFGAALVWDGQTDTVKEQALATAFRQLIASPDLSILATTTPTAAIKEAQCEQTIFLLREDGGADVRAGLHAQGVSAAGVLRESYRDGFSQRIPIAPHALQLLLTAGFDTRPSPIFVVELDRDDTEDTSESMYRDG